MQRLADSHAPLPLATTIATHLIERNRPEPFAHLAHARILFLLSQRAVVLRGHAAAAYICGPRVQGPLSDIVADMFAAAAGDLFDGHDPDFIVRVDAVAWDTLADTEPAAAFWRARKQFLPKDVSWTVGRERLIAHELLHVYQRLDKDGAPRTSEEDGRPVLALRPHDAEYFHAELAAYGPTVCGAVPTALAIAHGGRTEAEAEKRTRRRAS